MCPRPHDTRCTFLIVYLKNKIKRNSLVPERFDLLRFIYRREKEKERESQGGYGTFLCVTTAFQT